MPIPLNQMSGFPQMNAAFSNWTIKMTWSKVVQTIVDNGFPQQQEINYTVDGVFQPMSEEAIQLKPDGQWSWPWFWLHIKGKSSPFETNDVVKYNGITYKVMGKKDYSLNNYTMLELVKDYQ